MEKEKEIPIFQTNRTAANKFIESSKSLSIINLNVNNLNLPLKKCVLKIDWIKKLEQTICCQQETHLNKKG